MLVPSTSLDPENVEKLARRMARLECCQEHGFSITAESLDATWAIIRIYEDENWPRFVEEAVRILEADDPTDAAPGTMRDRPTPAR